MMEEPYSPSNTSDLLTHLEHILKRDPLIDEVGFIHPSQFSMLNDNIGLCPSINRVSQPEDEILTAKLLDVDASQHNATIFWNKDHKLAISTLILFPLYNAARDAFLNAYEQHKTLNRLPRKTNKFVSEMMTDNTSVSKDFLESEVMMHSKALLLLSCDFGTAWNSRKLVLSQKQKFSLHLEELLLSALVLSYSPKSEYAWGHRRWVIKKFDGENQILQEILKRESELVEKIAEKSKMNYRAWNHRCWLITYMTREQVLDELRKSRKWAELHVADNCCFHYRRRLLLRMLENNCTDQSSNVFLDIQQVDHLWKEELDWDEMLIKRYVGREALWIHRRFLAQLGINHFANDGHGTPSRSGHPAYVIQNISIFFHDELQFLGSCLVFPDNDFEDGQAQAGLAASYIMWLSKQIPLSGVREIQEMLRDHDLKTLLNKFCPEKTRLWDDLMG